jgi:hypothetical protein
MQEIARFKVIALALLFAACGSNEPPGSGSGGSSGTGGRGGSSGAGGTSTGGGSGGSMTGTGGATSTDGGTMASGDYFPFKVGNSWEYNVTELGKAQVVKVHKIVRMETIGGTSEHKDKMAFRVETQKAASGAELADATISWQQREGSKIIRFRETACVAGSVMMANGSVQSCTINDETSWVPPRPRIDEKPMNMNFAKGLMWTEMFAETRAQKANNSTMMLPPMTMNDADKWEVVDVGVSATVPAGTFPDCVVLKKTSLADAMKTYTFCKGVGKVKEDGPGQVEILTKYQLM